MQWTCEAAKRQAANYAEAPRNRHSGGIHAKTFGIQRAQVGFSPLLMASSSDLHRFQASDPSNRQNCATRYPNPKISLADGVSIPVPILFGSERRSLHSPRIDSLEIRGFPIVRW